MHSFDGLIFDMDGTLTRPTLDFQAIRREIGVPAGDLVEEIGKLPPARRAAAWSVIEAHEERAIGAQQLQDGVEPLFDACRRSGVRRAILTRNTRKSVDALCAKYGLRVDTVVTREFFFIKPHPAPIRHILAEWAIPPERVLTIGDYVHDIACGRAAGTRTCLFRNPDRPDDDTGADYVVRSMAELRRLVFPDEK
jgi:HAD superfamily hydrolase (TIGR01549 family)